MIITIPLLKDVTVTIQDTPSVQGKFPTSCLQKGWLMSCRGENLAEEAVGFGVPIIKRGLKSYFPGEIALESFQMTDTWMVKAIYTINLEEKIAMPGKSPLTVKPVYLVKNLLAAVIRQFEPGRRYLTALSSSLRKWLGFKTVYGISEFITKVEMNYRIDSQKGEIDIQADFTGLTNQGVTEVVVMNEQGATYFDGYMDDSGLTLFGDEIGLWDEVITEQARFISSSHKLAFGLQRQPGTHLFRGREWTASRLAWSGFGHSIAPSMGRYNCTVKVERLP